MRQIAERNSITVFGDGSQQCDFTYVDDIALGTIAAVAPLGYEVINLGAIGQCGLTQLSRKLPSDSNKNRSSDTGRPTRPTYRQPGSGSSGLATCSAGLRVSISKKDSGGRQIGTARIGTRFCHSN